MSGRQRWFFQGIGSLCLALGVTLLMMDQSEAAWEVTPSFSLSISGRYDSNIESGETKKSDFVTTVTPQFNLSLQQQETRISVGGAAGTKFFTENSKLNRTSIRLFAKLNQSLSPITSLALSESIRFTPESLRIIEASEAVEPSEEGEEEDVTGIIVRRGDRIANNTTVTVSHRSSPRTTESVRYALRWVSFENPDLFDSITHEGRFNITHQLSRLNAMTTGYRYRYFDRREREAEDSQAHGLTVGLAHSISPTLKLSERLTANYTIEPASSRTSLGGGVRLSKTLKELLRLRMGYSINISTSEGVSEDLVRTHAFTASVIQTVSRNVKAKVTGRYADNRSVSGDGVEIISWRGTAGLTYQFRPWLSLGLGYSHLDQNSRGLEGQDVVRDQYGFNVRAVYP